MREETFIDCYWLFHCVPGTIFRPLCANDTTLMAESKELPDEGERGEWEK